MEKKCLTHFESLFHRLYSCYSDGVLQPTHDKTNKTKRLSPRNTSNRLSLRDSNPRLRNSNINSSKRRHRSSSNISSSKRRGSNSINSSRRKLRNNSNISSSNKLRDNRSVSSRTTQRSTSSKPVCNRINNANSGNSKTTPQNKISSKRRGNTISNNASSKTIQRGGGKPEDSRISNVSSRTTGPHNNGARLRFISNRSPGKVIVPRVGSLSTAPGSNVAVTTVTAFQITVSVATMASLMSSASTASP